MSRVYSPESTVYSVYSESVTESTVIICVAGL